ncbi:MAG: Endodeoxyribonuclease RusA [Blastocatellia bacterium]|jgi:Holliday junction resolvase RusA-like endonuclease|nr:Endodeoxyribonuclease RusA [Blastocatellia bacterium]
MSKRALKLSVRIPNFDKNALAWRKAIHAAIIQVQDRGDVRYTENDKLEVEIRLHLENPKLTILDLDNRAKTILDALQGFMQDKGQGGLRCIIPNDSQIYRLIVEKRLSPKANRAALSTIVIRRYDHDRRTVNEPRDTRKLPNLTRGALQ